MKTIMISGSRNPSGQTATAAQAVLAGLADQGAACEQVFLPARKVERLADMTTREEGVGRWTTV